MKIHVMTVLTGDDFNAGQKAPSDIVRILEKEYNCKKTFFKNYQHDKNKLFAFVKKIIKRLKFTFSFLKARICGDIVILQFPMFERTKLLNKIFLFNLKLLNKNKTIILIHDIDGIRSHDDNLYKNELIRYTRAKYMIVHNERMKKRLIEDGVSNKLFVLEAFDYLTSNTIKRKNIIDIANPQIVYAGNLSKVKSPFLHQLEKEKMNFNINIYGVSINSDINEKIKYKGKYSPDELPSKLEGDLGLIWDGNYDGSDEDKGMKSYTKLNNPHKLSCYMAASLPVIVWEKAAISDFVKKYNVGYIINNIYDINNLDFSDYNEKLENTKKIQKKIINGYYTKRVLDKVLKDICEK